MSAEVLREAARLMRERATEASGGIWSACDGGAAPVHVRSRWTDGQGRRCTMVVAEAHAARSESQAQDADHIASWHPAVALAVADWLDAEATTVEFDGGRPDLLSPSALVVATTYLGTTP